MRGIILAGGAGSRLYPITLGTSKQLLPIYNKPLIYYSLSVLMLAGIREIFLICKSEDKANFYNIFGNGSKFGINITYGIQDKPEGIAQSFLIAEKFIGNHNVSLILGDNIFWGYNFTSLLKQSILNLNGATIFGYPVKNPTEYGIAEINKLGKVKSIVEKPINPKSNIAITGLYFYDNDVISIAKSLKPSLRGELEISSINEIYMQEKRLNIKLLGRGYAWMDAGTFEGMLDASNFISTFEKRQGYKIACLEEIAFNNNWISKRQLQELYELYIKTDYGDYLKSIINGEK